MSKPARQLGRKPTRHDSRTLQLSHYVDLGALPPTPSTREWDGAVTSWPMYGNDAIGDCVPAGAAHAIQTWSHNAGRPVDPPESDVLYAYSAVGGYVAGDPNTDNGTNMLDMLNWWRKAGAGFGGHAITAYAILDTANRAMVKAAIDVFGGIFIGVAMPKTAYDETGPTKLWRAHTGAAGKPGSWGGHAVFVTGYSSRRLKLVTWGAMQQATWGFWNDYTEEAYACVSADWLTAQNVSPEGFDMNALLSDLSAVT